MVRGQRVVFRVILHARARQTGVCHIMPWKSILLVATLLAGLTLTACERNGLQTTADILEGAQLVIVSLGDSFASGEGNPDVPSETAGDAGWLQNAGFAAAECHRSRNSGHRFAVERVADAWTLSDEEIYLNLACSGSSTHFGLRFSRLGSADICNLPGVQAPAAPYCNSSQIRTARNWAANPDNGIMRIDVVLLSIGLNDLGFGGIVKACVTPKLTPFHPDCHLDPGITDMLQHGCLDTQNDDDPSDLPLGCGGNFRNGYGGLDRLQARVEREIRRIREELDPKHIILIGYPDPTRDENGDFCANHNENFIVGQDLATGAFNPQGGTGFGWIALPVGASTSEVSLGETMFAFNNILVPLNLTLQAAAQAEGVDFVDELAAVTRDHGVCASTPWFHGFRSSFENQGDPMGVLHPNTEGHMAMSFTIEAKLREVLGLPQTAGN